MPVQKLNKGRERVSNSEIGNFLQYQGIPQIDAEIVKKCHFWMDTKLVTLTLGGVRDDSGSGKDG
jgi:hypothetical protein